MNFGNPQQPPQPRSADEELVAVKGQLQGVQDFLDITAERNKHYDKIEQGLNALYDMEDFQGTKSFMELSGTIAFMKRKDKANVKKAKADIKQLRETKAKIESAMANEAKGAGIKAVPDVAEDEVPMGS